MRGTERGERKDDDGEPGPRPGPSSSKQKETFNGLPHFICAPDPESQKKIEVMLQSSPCGLIVTENTGEHLIVYVNKIFEFMTGYTAEEIVGKDCRFLQFRGPASSAPHELVDRNVTKTIRECLRDGKDFRGEIVNFRKDGTPLLNSLFIAPIRSDTENPLVITHFVGIQNFRPADHFNLAPLTDEEREGTVSSGAASPEQKRQRRGDSPVEGPSTSQVCLKQQDFFNGLPPFIRAPDPESQKKLEVMLQSSPCGLIVTENNTGEHLIVYVNKIFEFMTGYTAEEIVGKDCRFLQFRGPASSAPHELVDRNVTKTIRECLRDGKDFRGEIVNFRKDGTPLLNSLFITPIRSNTENPLLITHFVGIQNFRPADHFNLAPLPEEGSCKALMQGEFEVDRIASSGKAQVRTNTGLVAGTSQRPAPCFGALDLHDELWNAILGYLPPKELAKSALVCQHFRRLQMSNSLWYRCLVNVIGERECREIRMTAGTAQWHKVASDILSLKSARWHPFGVGGGVRPERTNFALCAMGTQIILFGGEGANRAALNDLYVLDLAKTPSKWEKVHGNDAPVGRWGHTMHRICDNWIVIFGGSNSEGTLNDTSLLEIRGGTEFLWYSVPAENMPLARSWHTSTVVNGEKLVIFGGCNENGDLLSDTQVLDFSAEIPVWKEIAQKSKPPSRLGHSLCVVKGGFLFMFGGFATAGPVRLRTADAFTINLDDAEPSWKYLSGKLLPSGENASMGDVPTPRLQHAAISLWDGHIAVLGGSTSEIDSQYHPSQAYIIRPEDPNPRWEKLQVTGVQPGEVWGYSACRVGASILLPSGGTGSVSPNDFYALSFAPLDGDEREANFGLHAIWRESNTEAFNGRYGPEERVVTGNHAIQTSSSSDDGSLELRLRSNNNMGYAECRGSSPSSSNLGSGSDGSVSSPVEEGLPLFLKLLIDRKNEPATRHASASPSGGHR